MYKKIARKYMSRVLSDYLQQAVSNTQISLLRIERLRDRAMALINESSYKDLFYKEGGDVLSAFQEEIESLREEINVASYLIGKISNVGVADDIRPNKRKELEDILRTETSRKEGKVLEDIVGPLVYNEPPNPVEEKRPRDMQEPLRGERDLTEVGVGLNTPKVPEDAVRR